MNSISFVKRLVSKNGRCIFDGRPSASSQATAEVDQLILLVSFYVLGHTYATMPLRPNTLRQCDNTLTITSDYISKFQAEDPFAPIYHTACRQLRRKLNRVETNFIVPWSTLQIFKISFSISKDLRSTLGVPKTYRRPLQLSLVANNMR